MTTQWQANIDVVHAAIQAIDKTLADLTVYRDEKTEELDDEFCIVIGNTMTLIDGRIVDEDDLPKIIEGLEKALEITSSTATLPVGRVVKSQLINQKGVYCKYCEFLVEYSDMKPWRKDDDTVDMLCPGCDSVLAEGE